MMIFTTCRMEDRAELIDGQIYYGTEHYPPKNIYLLHGTIFNYINSKNGSQKYSMHHLLSLQAEDGE